MRAWVHEARRIFCDRLVNREDYIWVNGLLKTTQSITLPDLEWSSLFRTDSSDPSTNELVIFCDFLVPGADPKVSSLTLTVTTAMTPHIPHMCLALDLRGDRRSEGVGGSCGGVFD